MARIRSILSQLKASYETGGVQSLHQAHIAALKASRRYRFISGLINLVYPANGLLDVAANLDYSMGQLGMTNGSAAILRAFGLRWATRLPQQGHEVISTSPIIVYGKHGSILTPFLIASSLGRTDLKMLSASYIASLGPHVAASMFPVFVPRPTFRSSGKAGIVPRISGWLTTRLEPPVDRSVAKARNRESLALAAEHVRKGGAILLAPDARDSQDRWQRGLGQLIAQIAQGGKQEDTVYLVPYRIWAPIAGAFRLVSRNPILKALAKLQYRKPIRIEYGIPIPLDEMIEQTGLDALAITHHLQAHYRRLGF